MVIGDRTAGVKDLQPLDEYNYERFRTKHFVADLRRTVQGEGVQPGQEAPDFELESTEGEPVRLSGLRGRPVMLHFGSGTWPITAGGVPPLKQLHAEYGDRVRFIDIFLRQAHPGEERGAYRTYEEKREGAREYQREEGLVWPVLVDEISGTVHQTYGGMADSVYLLDAAGRVAFYGMWMHAPTLKGAIDELLAGEGQGGAVAGGIDRTPHLLASFVGGWHGLRRGGRRAVLDFELAVPGGATLTFLGDRAKPVLAPLALRTTPLPAATRFALGGGLGAAALLLVWRRRRQ